MQEPTPTTRYSEKEVSEILRLAAEAQSGTRSTGSSDGMTLAEIQKLAGELGIDPAKVQTAAQNFAGRDQVSLSKWLFGAPEESKYTRILKGEISEEGWDRIVGGLNSAFQQAIPGVVSGSQRVWKWQNQSGGWVHLEAMPEGGDTRITMTSNIGSGVWGAALAIGLPAFIFGLIFMFSGKLAGMVGPIIGAAMMLGSSLGVRLGVSDWFRKDQRKLNTLMDDLATSADVRSRLAQESEAQPELRQEAQERLGQ